MYDNAPYLFAMANDRKFTDMSQYNCMADKIMVPQVLFLIQYITQKLYSNESSEFTF